MLRLQTVTTAARPKGGPASTAAGFVAFVLVAGAFCLAPATAPLLAAGSTPQLSLSLNLASSQELSAMSTGALVAEVNAIWWHSHVSLIWRTADVSDPLPAMPESENWLRVLVLARQRSNGGETSTFTVGELVRTEGARPIAIASLTAARRIVDESQRFQILEGPRDYDHRLGVVLGRAVAHEIGHYLLGPAHASHGLMRANIDALEFADVRSRTFLLDQPARASLTPRVTAPPVSSFASR